MPTIHVAHHKTRQEPTKRNSKKPVNDGCKKRQMVIHTQQRFSNGFMAASLFHTIQRHIHSSPTNDKMFFYNVYNG